MKKLLYLILLLCATYPSYALKPSGLVNVGNSCFLNAALQCLSNLDNLNEVLLAQEKNYYNGDSIAESYKDFIKDFAKATSNKETSFNALILAHKAWKMLDSNFGRQEDAAEFIDFLFMRLTDYDIHNSIKAKLNFYPDTTLVQTPVSDLVISLVNSVVTPIGILCKSRMSTEPTSMLHIPLNSSYKNLSDCLIPHFATELLQKKSKFALRKGVYVDALKTLSIKHLPQYVIVDIKRKRQSFSTLQPNIVKITEPLSFPLEGLHFTPYLGLSTIPKTHYSLNSFIVHSGSASGGHYTSYVKKNGIWYYCNDKYITEVKDTDMQEIAQRGYGLDPDFAMNNSSSENIARSKEQNPVIFFYEKQQS